MRSGAERMKDRARYKCVRGSGPPRLFPVLVRYLSRFSGGLPEGAHGLAALPRKIQNGDIPATKKAIPPQNFHSKKKRYDVCVVSSSIPLPFPLFVSGPLLWDTAVNSVASSPEEDSLAPAPSSRERTINSNLDG